MLHSTKLIQELRQGNIEESSRNGYMNRIASFLVWLFNYNPDSEEIVLPEQDNPAAPNVIQQQLEEEYHCPLNTQFKAFMSGLPDDLSESMTKKKIKEYLKEQPANPHPVVDFTILTEIHFVRYVLSLRKRDRSTPQFSTYNGHRAGIIYTSYIERRRALRWMESYPFTSNLLESVGRKKLKEVPTVLTLRKNYQYPQY